jgi:hypothetical protein
LIVLTAALAAMSASAVAPALAETVYPTHDVAGEKAGDQCMQSNGGPSCCGGRTTCLQMLECDAALNACKKDKMAHDAKCESSECQRCTSAYKACHDSATQALKPVSVECVVDRGSLTMVGTNPNIVPEMCNVTCTYKTADKVDSSMERTNVQLPPRSTRLFLGSNNTPGKTPLAYLTTKASCQVSGFR